MFVYISNKIGGRQLVWLVRFRISGRQATRLVAVSPIPHSARMHLESLENLRQRMTFRIVLYHSFPEVLTVCHALIITRFSCLSIVGLMEYIHVQRSVVLFCAGGVFIKNDIQNPVKLVFY
jgi:hypothetical protein